MKKTLRQKILEEVKSNPGLSLKELSRLLEVSQNTLKNIVYKLKSEGYIEKAGDGYVITPRGERFWISSRSGDPLHWGRKQVKKSLKSE